MLDRDQTFKLRAWLDQVVQFMRANDLEPLVLLTAKQLGGGLVECGAIACPYTGAADDVLRTAAREGVESVIVQRQALEAARRIILPQGS